MTATDWIERARELAAIFEKRAPEHDERRSFVAENYADLKRARMFSAPISEDLGGGGVPYADVCRIVRVLARACGSTALAFSMHAHQACFLDHRWRQGDQTVEALLRRVASSELVLVTTGGADWLGGSGRAEAVSGGYRVTARKHFASGCPAGDVLLTCAILEDAPDGAWLLHFPLDFGAAGLKVVQTWDTMGMRGTGSNDIVLESVFVPTERVVLRRRPGRWHPLVHNVYVISFPLILSAYMGIAEAARDAAVELARRRRDETATLMTAGLVELELRGAQLALQDAIDLAGRFTPGMLATNEMMIRKGLVVRGCLAVVERALELAGGSSFYRSKGLERMFRDMQAARYHPLPDAARCLHNGQVAMGVDLETDFHDA